MIKILITRFNKDTNQINAVAVSPDYKVAQLYTGPMNVLGEELKGKKVTPWNFSVKRGKVEQDAGVFARLGDGTHDTFIVLDMLVSENGRIVGYTVFNVKTSQILRLSKQDILTLDKQTKGTLLQNGIVSNGAVKSFPGHPFTEKQLISENKPKPTTKTRGFGDTPKVHENFNNKKLSTAQQAVLDEGKKRGIPIKYFDNAAIPKDVMQFYVDNVYNEKVAKDCAPIFANPKLKKGQVKQLYKSAILGIDVTPYCDENLSSDELQTALRREKEELFCEVDRTTETDAELLLKAIEWANREKAEGWL